MFIISLTYTAPIDVLDGQHASARDFRLAAPA